MNTLSHPRTKHLARWAAALAIAFAAANLPAAPPSTINYQGQLTQENGKPASGTMTMTFSLYTVPEGETPIWSEVQHDVNVDMGLFSVALGTVVPFADDDVDFSKPYFLEIEVGTETFSPRVPLRSTPYAMLALTVHEGAVGSPQLADGAVTSSKLHLQPNDLAMQTIDGLNEALAGKLSLEPAQSPIIDIADDQADTQLEITNSDPDKQADLHVEGNIVAGGKVIGHNTPTMVQKAFTGVAPHASLAVEHAPDPYMRRVVQVYFEKDPFGDESDGEVLVDSTWEGPFDEKGNPMLEHDLNATTLTVKNGTTLNTAGHAIHATGTVTVEASATITDLVSGGYGGYAGMGGYGVHNDAYPADPGQPGQPGENPQDRPAGKGGNGGGGGGGGAAQSANATSTPGGRGGDGGHGGQGGGIVIVYCNQLQVENGGLIHANGMPGENGQDGDPGQYLSDTDHSAASGGGGGGAGGAGGDGGFVDILVAQPLETGIEQRIQAQGGAGGAGGNGGLGLDTTAPTVGVNNDGWGQGVDGGGNGGPGEAGNEASGSGENGADGAEGTPGIVNTFVWEGQQRVLADSREFRVFLSQDSTTVRNETGESFENIWVNIVLPSTAER